MFISCKSMTFNGTQLYLQTLLVSKTQKEQHEEKLINITLSSVTSVVVTLYFLVKFINIKMPWHLTVSFSLLF